MNGKQFLQTLQQLRVALTGITFAIYILRWSPGITKNQVWTNQNSKISLRRLKYMLGFKLFSICKRSPLIYKLFLIDFAVDNTLCCFHKR